MERVYGPERAQPGEAAGPQRPREGDGRRCEPWQQVLHVDLARQAPRRRLLGRALREGRAVPAAPRGGCSAASASTPSCAATSTPTRSRASPPRLRRLAAGGAAGQRSRARPRPLDLDRWLNEPGLPPDAPRSTSAGAGAGRPPARSAWLAGTRAAELDTTGWVTPAVAALHRRPARRPPRRAHGRARRAPSASPPSRQQRDPRRLAGAGDQARLPRRRRRASSEFLLTVGRRKFLKPLYTELARTARRAGSARAPSTPRPAPATTRWRPARSTRSLPWR